MALATGSGLAAPPAASALPLAWQPDNYFSDFARLLAVAVQL